MSMQMKLDEMLEALQALDTDKAERFDAILCATGTEMASIIAQHHDCDHGEATMEGVAFAGICAPFMPRYQNQPFPKGWEMFDDGGREEWEAYARSDGLPDGPPSEPRALNRSECTMIADALDVLSPDSEAAIVMRERLAAEMRRGA